MTKRIFGFFIALIAFGAVNSRAIYAASNQTITPAADGEILLILASDVQPDAQMPAAKTLYTQLDSEIQLMPNDPLLKGLHIRVEQAAEAVPDRASAQTLADDNKATLVIWNHMGDDTLTVHYEITPRWKAPIESFRKPNDFTPAEKYVRYLSHLTLSVNQSSDPFYIANWTRALVLFSDQQFYTALSVFEGITKHAQNEPRPTQKTLGIGESWFYIGYIREVVQRNIAGAEQAYTQAVLMNGRISEAYFNRAYLMLGKNRFAAAVPDLNKVIQLNHGDAVAYFLRGSFLMGLSQNDQAEVDILASIFFNPRNPVPYDMLGEIHINEGRYAEAVDNFTQAIKLDPRYAMTYVNRGVAYDSLNKFDKELADYASALEIAPNLIMAYANRGTLLQKLGEIDEALDGFRDRHRDWAKRIRRRCCSTLICLLWTCLDLHVSPQAQRSQSRSL